MRIVVKIGSSSLVDSVGGVRADIIAARAADIATVMAAGHHVVLVSSGAIATGLGLLGFTARPRELPALQAASAVGQGELFSMWAAAFETTSQRAAQVLLTMHDASHRASWVNARNTLEQLLAWNVVPIVNENDTTATDEITFGDNDTLAAQVAVAIDADLLVLLTDTDGLYTEHPSSPAATLIDVVEDRSLLTRIDTATPGSHWGSGGMRSKVVAAEMASAGGTLTHIARATVERVVERSLAGEAFGTRVIADERQGTSFKLWLRYAKKPNGIIRVDSGAQKAITSAGASLLAVGVLGCEGAFTPGDAVSITSEADGEFARGITEYSATELVRLIGEGGITRGTPAVVHRDELVLT
ncbi:MAG: glutamate 5-kinase [Thermoleophilia bacterium]|nr:glutamate 5-kinase [Thermoleophilia bacterium]